jgi:O-methyltransferase
MSSLDRLGLGDPVRRTLGKAVRRCVDEAKARGWTRWDPLVPEAAFYRCCIEAIRRLRAAHEEIGPYLEFGVSRGTSLATMYRALEAEGLRQFRLVGFDSFRGLPPEAVAQGWQPAAFRSTRNATELFLKKSGVDLSRVDLVEGWFSDTLSEETAKRLALTRASLIMIDCDIYSASREALWFCAPLIRRRAVIFFDDWGWRADKNEIGQREAFAEFLREFGQFSAEPIEPYISQARVFLVTRDRPESAAAAFHISP